VHIFHRFKIAYRAARICHFFPKCRNETSEPELFGQSGPEGFVERSYQLASAMLALAFAAVMLIAGQQFIEYQANKRDLMHLPAKARSR